MLADIAAEAERLHEIIENLLSLARLGTGTRARARTDGTRPSDRAFRRQIQRRYPDHPIAFSSRPSVIVEAERTYLELLVENLVGNAAKYSPEGSPIDVLVEEAEEEVRVLVLDRGIGLDEQLTADCSNRSTGRGARSTAGGVGLGWPSVAGSWSCSAGASGHVRATRLERSSDSRCRSRRPSTTCRCGPFDRGGRHIGRVAAISQRLPAEPRRYLLRGRVV